MWKKAVCAAALAAVPVAQASFRCVDEKGNAWFQDTPPAACGNVVIYEVSSQGTVIRKLEPTTVAAPKDLNAERLVAEQKRRDRALVETYTSPAEIDMARDRNLDIIRSRLEGVKTRLAQIESREGDLQVALASYKGKPAPALQQDLEKVQADKALWQASMVRFQKDYEQTQTQFDGDRKRWIELKGDAK